MLNKMATVKTIFKMTNKEIDDILKSNHKFALLVKRVALMDRDIFYKIKDLTSMTIEELIKNLPKELAHHELKEFVIYKPKTNKELRKAVKSFTDNPEESFKLHGHIENWDTSLITDMSYLFKSNNTFNSDISNWNTSKVVDTSYMFDNASIFNQPLNKWNVSNVTNMSFMFRKAIKFNQTLNEWNVNNVTDMNGMFFGATNFNQSLDNWNVSNVTNMSHMFCDAVRFNQPLNRWDVSNVTAIAHMFDYSTIEEKNKPNMN